MPTIAGCIQKIGRPRAIACKALKLQPKGGLLLPLPPVQERQPLEKLHILLVLQERAMQRRDELARVALSERLGVDILAQGEA